jgi:hypothetical protein
VSAHTIFSENAEAYRDTPCFEPGLPVVRASQPALIVIRRSERLMGALGLTVFLGILALGLYASVRYLL